MSDHEALTATKEFNWNSIQAATQPK